MPTPRPHIDTLLEKIGPAGEIVIVASATLPGGTFAKLRLTNIETINGIDVNQPAQEQRGRAAAQADD